MVVFGAPHLFPDSVRKIIERAIKDLSPSRIVLFGSRGRGEGTETSDFDLAFFGVTDDPAWTRFYNYVMHDSPTLFHIDLVRYEIVSAKLQRRIDLEGKVIACDEA
jgi:predicted nucleotidyltransferase